MGALSKWANKDTKSLFLATAAVEEKEGVYHLDMCKRKDFCAFSLDGRFVRCTLRPLFYSQVGLFPFYKLKVIFYF